MVSVLKRQLSVLLVATIATSWLVLPLQRVDVVKAQTASSSTSTSTSGTSNSTGGTADPVCPAATDTDDVFSDVFNNPAYQLPSLPQFNSLCFALSGGTLAHRFSYKANPQIAADNTTFEMKFTKSPLTVFGGCDDGIQNGCAKGLPEKYNFFTIGTPGRTQTSNQTIPNASGPGLGSSIQHLGETYAEAPIAAYQLKSTVATGANVITWSDGTKFVTSDLYLLASSDKVYGFYTVNPTFFNQFANSATDQITAARQATLAQSRSEIDFTFLKPADASAYTGRSGNTLARPFWHYVALMNGLDPSFSLPHGIPTDGAAASLSALQTAVVGFFGHIYNDTATCLKECSPGSGEGDLDLIDDPADKTIVDGRKAPVVAPIIHLSSTHTPLGPGNDFTFRFKYLIRSPELYKGRNNNYLLFTVENLNDEQKQLLAARGIADMANIYLVVDVGGNVGFVVDDKTVFGGIFKTGKDRLDIGKVNFIAFGNFDGNQVGVSQNADFPRKPLNINTIQYRNTLTRRIYNGYDQVKSSLSYVTHLGGLLAVQGPLDLTACGNETKYPFENATYGDNIPLGELRKCINPLDPQGWMFKWGIKEFRLDQSPADDCSQAFNRGGIFNAVLGTAVCFFINTMISGATWFAGLSVEFLLAVIGLQS